MTEILLVLGALVAVGVLGFLATVLTPALMTELGLWILLGGLVIGVPAGLWYHTLLYRTLARKMPLPSKWWLAPVVLHPHLAPDEFAPIHPWYMLGALGFTLSLVGGITALAGLLTGS
ncbi:MAG: hypothetical protein ACE5MM_00715 [Nitrospiraceae bacterium]